MTHPILHNKQQEIVKSSARFKVIRAGRRSGKSSVEIEILIFKAVSKKDQNIFYISPTQKQSRSIIWEALKGRLGKIGEANESRLEMKLPTTEGGFSTIYIAGWENRENFRGMKAHHITFDELDTMKDFFIGWQEIFRPALIDTVGTADFIGTPKKENPNLRRLEKEFGDRGEDFACFHFTTADNPHIPKSEIEKAREEMDGTSYKQEILAEYIEDVGSLFKYSALVDMFTNTITKNSEKYQIVDVADDGSDKTVFGLWEGLELYKIDKYERLNTENIIDKIRENNAEHKIPMSQSLVDAIGVGAGVASSSRLDGIIGYKSSYGAIKTDVNPVLLPNIHYITGVKLTTDYANLRSQCVFTLADVVNNHKISIKIDDVRVKEAIIEELSHYQDISKGDGKRLATHKEDIKAIIGRSPDLSDILLMRMYFVLKEKMSPNTSEQAQKIANQLRDQFETNKSRQKLNNTR